MQVHVLDDATDESGSEQKSAKAWIPRQSHLASNCSESEESSAHAVAERKVAYEVEESEVLELGDIPGSMMGETGTLSGVFDARVGCVPEDVITGASKENLDYPSDKKRPHTLVNLTIPKRFRLIERRKTLLSVLVKNKKCFALLLAILKSRILVTITTVLWLVCNLISLCACYRIQVVGDKTYITLQIFTTLNFLMQHSVCIRWEVLKELSTSFSFWYTIYNAVSFHVCLLLLWGLELKTIGIFIHSTSSVLLMILYDSHARRNHRVMKLSSIIGTISYAPIYIALSERLVSFETEKINVGSNDFELVDLRLQAMDNLSTLILYILRIIVNHNLLKKDSSITFLSEFYEIDTCDEESSGKDIKVDKSTSLSLDNTGANTQKNIGENARDVEKTIRPSQANQERKLHLKNTSEDKMIYENGDFAGVLGNQFDKKKYLVLGIPESKTVTYETHETLYHKFIRKRIPFVRSILVSKVYNISVLIFCLASMILSWVFAVGVNASKNIVALACGVVSIGSLIFLFQMIIACNHFMLKNIVRSFDYWYVIYLLVKGVVSSGTLCGWDVRLVFWIYQVLLLEWAIMIDTFGVRFRRLSYLIIVGFVFSISFAILCKLGIGETFSQDKNLGLVAVKEIPSKVALSSALFSYAVFTFRFFWSYHKNKKRILFMIENITLQECQ